MTMGSAALDDGSWRDPAAADARLAEMLGETRRIAVLGAKPASTDGDAHRIPLYLQSAGYSVVGVNPRLRAGEAFEVAPTLTDVAGPIDLVNVFRAPEHIPAHTTEILSLPERPRFVWFQLGIVCGQSAARLRAAGVEVVQDLCIMVEHRRLIASAPR